MIDRIDALKIAIQKERLQGSQEQKPLHWFYLEGFTSYLDDPFEIREAKARLHFYRNVPIKIFPGEAIVCQIDWDEPLACFISNTHIRTDILENIYQGNLAEEEKDRIRHMIEETRPFCFDPMKYLTEEERLVQESHLAPSIFFNGHMVPDYAYFLQHGFRGVLAEIQRYRNRQLTEEEQNFYDAMEITVEGLSLYIQRHADLAKRLLEEENPGYDPRQLQHIIQACTRIAWEPVQTFPEALQLMWFLICFVDYDSFGRTDQYLLPYYEASRNTGMADAEALLWLKYTFLKIEACGGILNMTIGGRTPDGSSAVNPLTYLILRATRELGFRSPNLSLRIRESDPDALWFEMHRSLSGGQGLPALYNDDLIVPMLVEMGYSEEESLDYCLAGCSQVILPGKSNFACDVGCYNLLKVFELALHDGYDVIMGKQVGPHTGEVHELDTYEKFKQAYDTQMRFMTRLGVAINNKDVSLRQNEGACVRSLVTRDCIERGQGYFHGGARYYNVQNEACGITNAANSLFALRQMIYEEKIISLAELVRILDENWEGEEILRQRFMKRCAKFGNDIDAVDSIRAQISSEWYREIQQYPGALGGIHLPGEVVFIYHELHGAATAATPDGRKMGEAMANSAGASAGTDTRGPSALLRSMLKIPQNQCRTCCVLNLRFSQNTWEQKPSAVIELLQAYFREGGFQVQINLVNRDDLLDARQHPEKYADLVVRVGGFSDYFVRLSDVLQEEIIARTEHSLSD